MGRVEAGVDAAAALAVEVIYCPAPGVNERVTLTLALGATVADALRESGLLVRHQLNLEGLRVGVWCKSREPGAPLRDRDRVEIYRPLTVDPKEARRLRYKRHRETSAAR